MSIFDIFQPSEAEILANKKAARIYVADFQKGEGKYISSVIEEGIEPYDLSIKISPKIEVRITYIDNDNKIVGVQISEFSGGSIEKIHLSTLGFEGVLGLLQIFSALDLKSIANRSILLDSHVVHDEDALRTHLSTILSDEKGLKILAELATSKGIISEGDIGNISKKREAIYEAIDTLVENLDFTVIAAAINKTKLKGQYGHPTNPYHLCFQFILERAVMYLGRSNGKMMFRIESRETHNDQKLSEVYEHFRNNDHNLFKKDEIQSKLADLSFNQKIQNIAGMQIADLVAYPIGKWVLDNSRENEAFTIIEKKLHKKPGTNTYFSYGLKVFP